jgi:hypothetical protein
MAFDLGSLHQNMVLRCARQWQEKQSLAIHRVWWITIYAETCMVIYDNPLCNI